MVSSRCYFCRELWRILIMLRRYASMRFEISNLKINPWRQLGLSWHVVGRMHVRRVGLNF